MLFRSIPIVVVELFALPLAANARDFFSRRKNFQYDPRTHRIKVSAILDWFEEDFGSSQTARWNGLKEYLPGDAQAVATNSNTRVSFLEYDWSLNDQSRK